MDGDPNAFESDAVEDKQVDSEDILSVDADEPIDFDRLCAAVSAHYDADILVYNGPIDESGLGKVIEAVLGVKDKASSGHDNVLVLMTSNGGSANSAYQIARFLQVIYKKFILFAPRYCYSAGTLIALGAHQLVMSPFSELGPLDVQLLKQNELGARKSGLLARSAFQALSDSSFELFESFMLKIMNKSGGLISFRVAAELSATLTTGLMSPIYAKMDPDVIGSDQRDLSVAFHYGVRLVEDSGNADIGTVYYLINGYPAHDFVIDYREACDLFKEVAFPSNELMTLSALCDKLHAGADGTYVAALSNNSAEFEEDFNAKRQDEDAAPTEAPQGEGLGEGGDSVRSDTPRAAGPKRESDASNAAHSPRARRAGGKQNSSA